MDSIMDFDERGGGGGKGNGGGGGGGKGGGKGGGGGGKGGGGKGGGKSSGKGVTRTNAQAPFLQKIRQQMAQQEHLRHNLEDKTLKRRKLQDELKSGAVDGGNNFDDDIQDAVFVDAETGDSAGMSEFDQKMARKLQQQRVLAEKEEKEQLADAEKPLTFKLSAEKEAKRKAALEEAKRGEVEEREKRMKEMQKLQENRPEFYWRLSEEDKRIYDRVEEVNGRRRRAHSGEDRFQPICFHFNTKKGCTKVGCERKHEKIDVSDIYFALNKGGAASSGSATAGTKSVTAAAAKPKVSLNYDESSDEDEDDD
eukprot:g19096.t1